MKGFLLECLTEKTATLSLRPLNEEWNLMDWNACLRLLGEVSVGKVSITLPGEVSSRLERMLERFS